MLLPYVPMPLIASSTFFSRCLLESGQQQLANTPRSVHLLISSCLTDDDDVDARTYADHVGVPAGTTSTVCRTCRQARYKVLLLLGQARCTTYPCMHVSSGHVRRTNETVLVVLWSCSCTSTMAGARAMMAGRRPFPVQLAARAGEFQSRRRRSHVHPCPPRIATKHGGSDAGRPAGPNQQECTHARRSPGFPFLHLYLLPETK